MPFALVALLGCNTVTVEGGGWFPVLSAFSYPAWRAEVVTVSGGEVDRFDVESSHSATLSDVTLGCERARGYQADWNAASADLLAASDDGADAEAFCAGVPDFLDRMDQAEAHYPAELQRLSFSFCAEGSDDTPCGGDVPAGEWPLDGDGDVDATGWYRVDDDSERRPLAGAWSVDECAFDPDAYQEATDALDVELYFLEGSVTVAEGDGQVLSGSWEARLTNTDDDDALDGAETSGSFATSLCEVEEPDTLVWVF